MSKQLKSQTINALLWNTLDKVFTQVCYAVIGVILANLLSPDDFGLVGVLAVFTAFANIFIDGGFSNALIQKHDVSEKDYSTVFFFNILVSVLLYAVLFFTAPLIAAYFHNEELIVLSRVLFTNFIFYSLGVVQSSKLMKEMNMKKITTVNVISLSLSSTLALALALTGFGVWALVGQTLAFSIGRSAILWIINDWRPLWVFSGTSLRRFYHISAHLFMTSFVSTFFQNIYALIIGVKYNMEQLGYYTQADKWSKMGTTGLSQIIGYSIFPALSSIQNDTERMQRVYGKTNKMTAFLSFPVFIGLTVVAESLFHTLFGTKWDASIVMFQLLTIRGMFFIFTSLSNNYIMSIGKAKSIFQLEIVKDVLTLVALFVTIPLGIEALVIGQLVAGILHYLITLVATDRLTGYSMARQLKDLFPYFSLSALMVVAIYLPGRWMESSWLLLLVQVLTGAVVYVGAAYLTGSKLVKEVFLFFRKKEVQP